MDEVAPFDEAGMKVETGLEEEIFEGRKWWTEGRGRVGGVEGDEERVLPLSDEMDREKPKQGEEREETDEDYP